MTRLKIVHRQLSALRRWRQLVRSGAAWSALLTAVLWILIATFGIDVAFSLTVTQRLLVLAVGVGVAIWAFARYTVPLLGRGENEVETALLVEQLHGIDSDLVAALQFESPEAGRWGSRQLEDRVIDQVAGWGRSLDVFAGFSSSQLRRRGTALLATALVAGALLYAFPIHARVFLDRLLLHPVHYPSATVIEQVLVNNRPVLVRAQQGTVPLPLKCAEGLPVDFLVQCTGTHLPTAGTARLWSSAGRGRPLLLEAVTLEQRKSRLEEAAVRIRQAAERRDVDLTGPWAEEIAALTRYDSPGAADIVTDAGAAAAQQEAEIAAAVTQARAEGKTEAEQAEIAGQVREQVQARVVGQLRDAAQRLDDAVAAWPARAGETAVLRGQLPRLVDSIDYQLYLGDAWTDPARIDMIPLPTVELRMTTSPPRYAKTDAAPPVEPTARQVSVLEGSRVQVSLDCTNRKRLREVWLTVTSDEQHPRYQLTPTEGNATHFELTTAGTPFARVRSEIRFEAQVTDEDGLHLDAPARGYVRIKADRPPTCLADIVHRVVLPTAKPSIEYRVNDDYGISQLLLHLHIERGQNEGASSSTTSTEDERQTLSLLPGTKPISADGLPLNGKYVLELSKLQVAVGGKTRPAGLVKGDRVKLTLEAVDFRGDDAPGESYMSDPLVLEISDEAGVLAAISEADQRSEQRLTDIIKEQLGIGESP
jgi:hypothetical protein